MAKHSTVMTGLDNSTLLYNKFMVTQEEKSLLHIMCLASVII